MILSVTDRLYRLYFPYRTGSPYKELPSSELTEFPTSVTY